MKKIDFNKMENLQGGGFIDGFCGGFGFGLSLASLAMTIPGVNIAGGIVGGACLAYLAFS